MIGQMAGTESVTLLSQQMPAHTHTLLASTTAATELSPAPGQVLAAISGDGLYSTDAVGTAIATHPQTVSAVGGNLPHENTMPTLAVNFCMAWAGVFPSQG